MPPVVDLLTGLLEKLKFPLFVFGLATLLALAAFGSAIPPDFIGLAYAVVLVPLLAGAAGYLIKLWPRPTSSPPPTSQQPAGPTITLQPGAKADNNTLVAGDQTIHNTTIINPPPAAPPAPTAWRETYLKSLLNDRFKYLPLAALDTRLETQGAAVPLREVYVPLLTITPQEHEQWRKGDRDWRDVDSGRTERRLSALDQLDKHPRLLLLGDPGFGKSTLVNFITLCLAEAALGNPDRLTDLTRPVPLAEKKEERPQNWRWGPLLPVRVVLRELAADLTEHPPQPQQPTWQPVWNFIEHQLKAINLAEAALELKKELQQRPSLVMFDGLDEVPQANQRRADLIQMLEAFAKAFPQCRVLVTARVYAYQAQDWRLSDFEVATLAPFTLAQMRAFAEQWYTSLQSLHQLNVPPATKADHLLATIREKRQLRDLAERPLLLTLMAGLSLTSPLPEGRVELYEQAVNSLLQRWESGKDQQPSLSALLGVEVSQLRRTLAKLAYEAHANQPADQRGTPANIREDQLVLALTELSRTAASQKPHPDALSAHLQDRLGLIVHLGPQQYTFPHRTFQEYLAATHLNDRDPADLADLVHADADRWREVVLVIAAAWFGQSRGAWWSLQASLCPDQLTATADNRAAGAAAIAAQMWEEARSLNHDDNPTPRQDRDRAIQTRLTASLAAGVLGHPAVPPVERARAGRVLSALGDPRPGVGVVRAVVPLRVSKTVVRLWGDKPEHLGLPDITWVPVPGVPGFRLQTDEGDKGTYDIAPFYVAQYPVTNAQFQAFVQADDGWRDPRWWAGLAADADQRRAPREPAFPYANHPRERVSWWAAVAFGRWLSARLGWNDLPADLTLAGLKTSTAVRLPTEWEWQWAACPRQPQTGYPWEGDITPDHANYADTQIGQTSAVGCFPRGATLGGAYDLSGNVWEWCLNEYEKPANVALGGEQGRVVRGGAWFNRSIFARAVDRNRNVPDNHLINVGFRVVRAPVGLGS